MTLAIRTLLMALAVLSCSTTLLSQGIDVAAYRRSLRHAELLEQLSSSLEEAKADEHKTAIGANLALVRLEAELFKRVVTLEQLARQKPKELLPKVANLDKTAQEEMVLAGYAFLVGQTKLGEAALGRARDADPELKRETDSILAEARGVELPRGGYFRYRGLWLPLAERDHCRALDEALHALDAVELDGFALPFAPVTDHPNRERFDKLGDGVGEAVLRQAAAVIRKALEADYATVRSWLHSYAKRPKLRQRLLEKRDCLRPLQSQALALIRRYDKPEQPKVDEYRARLRQMYGDLRRLVESDFAPFRRVSFDKSWALHERLRRREGALRAIDSYFAEARLKRLTVGHIRPTPGSTVTTTHLLPGRRLSGLEDTLWLLVKHQAGQTIDVLNRGTDILNHKTRLTAWERLVLEIVMADAIDDYNDRIATSLDEVERDFVDHLNAYRRTLGLRPFELEERLNVCSMKHSQEMVDLGYFGHVSPVARNRGPTDRAQLEGYSGGVGENCLKGHALGRGAFEAWYHSPGHHRNLISGGPHLGVGAVNNHSMWTMVAGGTDWTWRTLHRDLPPQERQRLRRLVQEIATRLGKNMPAETQCTAAASQLPEILPELARVGFAAARDRRHGFHAAFPALMRILIEADVGTPWRALQISAVAATIEAMRYGGTAELRQQAWDLVRPLLQETFAFNPNEREGRRAKVTLEIRKHWEDSAQWRLGAATDAAPPQANRVVAREGDGPSLDAARLMLSRRARLRMAKQLGGSARTEKAVELGLKFLAQVQGDDGAWRAKSFALKLPNLKDNPRRGTAEFEIAMTGLALLAFSSAGYTTEEGEYAAVVAKGAQFLMGKILDYGKFETASSHYMYNHALATQALCELYSYSADPRLGLHAQLAVDYLVYAQHQQSGGWRYVANKQGDTSVTGWVILALNSAFKAKLDVSGFRGAQRFLDSVTQNSYYQVGYLQPHDGASKGLRLTAVGMTSRLFLGAQRRNPRLVLPAYRLLDDLPRASKPDFYCWYYATLALFQLGDPFWKKWNQALVATLLEMQDGDDRSAFYGSWAPRGAWARYGGRLYMTSLGVLMLTTYYRYDRAPKVRLFPFTGDIEKHVHPLLDAIRDEKDEQRRQIAMRKIADQFGSSLVPTVVRILRIGKEDKEFRQRLASLLVDIVVPRQEAMLIPLLEDTDREIAMSVIRAFVRISSRDSIKALVHNLDSPHRNVRAFCAQSLGQLGDAGAIAGINARLDKEKDNWVKGELKKALARLGKRSALGELLKKALPGKAVGYLAIIEGLEALERGGLVDFIAGFEKKQPRLHKRALKAMAEQQDAATIPLLMLIMESSELEQRTRALKLLRALTRKNFGFKPQAPLAGRRRALQEWQRWWKKATPGFTR